MISSAHESARFRAESRESVVVRTFAGQFPVRVFLLRLQVMIAVPLLQNDFLRALEEALDRPCRFRAASRPTRRFAMVERTETDEDAEQSRGRHGSEGDKAMGAFEPHRGAYEHSPAA